MMPEQEGHATQSMMSYTEGELSHQKKKLYFYMKHIMKKWQNSLGDPL
jgi:hypothetical protein